MKKSVFGAALAAVWMVGSVASAAPINLVARETSPTTWDVLAQANVDLGGIALVVTGFDVHILNLEGVPSISPLDSPLYVQPGTGLGFVMVNLVDAAGATLLPAGSPETRLMTLVGSDGPKTIVSGDEAFGYTALNPRLDTILDYSLTIVSTDGTSVTASSGGPPASAPIPEPRSIVVFAAGAIVVAWAIARSRRLGGEGARAA